jgi:MFS family permease
MMAEAPRRRATAGASDFTMPPPIPAPPSPPPRPARAPGATALKNYFGFILTNQRFLAFGLMMAFFSSFGQTYFIALFGDEIREAFDLSHSGFGLIYSGATLVSGFTIMWAGRMIDRVDLKRFTLVVCIGMILGCAAMAISPWIAVLALALFMLRFFGQGLLGHIAMTAMARYFHEGRGKAISIATLGYPAGEAILPTVAVVLIAAAGWREAWGIIALALAIIMIPLTLFLLRGQAQRHERLMEAVRANDPLNTTDSDDTSESSQRPMHQRQWELREVLRDVRFYMLLPAVLAPPMIATGMFFHAAHLVDVKGWTMPWYAACFVGFAATQLPSSLLTGPVIDRIGARRLFPVFVLPLILALLTLSAGNHALIALPYLMLIGITIGMTSPTVNAGWAELYGVLHLGSIRALSAALMVFSTAIAPAGFGVLIEAGVTMNAIAIMSAAYGAFACMLAFLGINRKPKIAHPAAGG